MGCDEVAEHNIGYLEKMQQDIGNEKLSVEVAIEKSSAERAGHLFVPQSNDNLKHHTLNDSNQTPHRSSWTIVVLMSAT